MNNKERILAKLQEDEGFMIALASVEDAVSAQKVLSDYQIELTLDEVKSMMEDGRKEVEKAAESPELSEEELVSVAGGGWVRGFVRLGVSAIAVGGYYLIVAACPAAIIAAPAIAAGLGLWSKAGFDKRGW